MSTTSLVASEVMDRSAGLLNDPAKTDYTYIVQLPFLNMAIDELVEGLEESNVSPTNETSAIVVVPVGSNQITPIENPITPHYPPDLVEIQEVSERDAGSNNMFIPLTRREFLQNYPPTSSLLYWTWENQIIMFNPLGAVTPRDVQLKYVGQTIIPAADSTSVIGVINARSFLSYKTAALCALFIGENESRAQILETEAQRALERMTGISNKGRQAIVTRHRPFRAGYKGRGWR